MGTEKENKLIAETVICAAFTEGEAEAIMMNRANEIFSEEISQGCQIDVKVQNLDEQKLRELIDGERLTVYEQDLDSEFVM